MPLPHDPYAPTDPYAVDASGAVVESVSAIQADVGPQNVVPKGTSAELLAWVGEDKDRARLALAAEQETSKPRKGLVDELNALLDPAVVGAEADADQ